MSKLLDQALDLAAQGYRVLPLRRGAKIPNLSEWQRLATTDPATIRKWWNRHPNANVGLATGSTFLVIDVDTKKGAKGAQSLSELRAAHDLPKTYTVKTPSGGIHLYYKHPDPARPIKNTVSIKLPCLTATKSGIDIRAEGGQVVAPGMYLTDHPDTPYTIIFDIPMAELPESLAEQLPYKDRQDELETQNTQRSAQTSITQEKSHETTLGRQPNNTQTSPERPPHTDNPQQEDQALRDSVYRDLPDYIRSTDGIPGSGGGVGGLVTDDDPSEYSKIPDRIPAGGRDDTLFRFMCSWRERNYPLAHAEILARELHLRLEQPRGDEISLSSIILKLHRTYKTYNPSARDEAELQAITPTQPIADTRERSTTPRQHAPPSDDNALPDPAGEYADIIEVPPEGVLDTVQAALNRFVFCIEGNVVIDTIKHPAYATIRMDAFKSAFGNIMLRTSTRENAKSKPLPDIWLKHKNRQTVDDYGYKPNGPKVYEHLGTKFYNKWAPSEVAEELKNGLECNDRDSGDHSCSSGINSSAEELKPFWNHLDYLFGDDEKEKQAFWRWLAFSVRYPERRVAHGVLIVSAPGVGKSWYYKLLQKLVGVYEVNTAGNNELNSDFNGWVFGCSMVVIHELMTGSKQHMMQQLLSLITEERILINEKHKQPRMRDIFANFLCFSNHANAAALGAMDRRFFVYMSAAVKESNEYYKKLFAWLDTDGPLHLLQHIHQMDLSDFNPGEAPMTTAAKRSMTHANMCLVEQAIVEAVEDRIGPFVSDVTAAEIVEKWLEARMEMSRQDRYKIRTTLTNFCPPLRQSRYRFHTDPKQHRLRAVRNGARWAKADTIDVLNEFEKSLTATSAPVTKLEVV
jgi:hypothetical protein